MAKNNRSPLIVFSLSVIIVGGLSTNTLNFNSQRFSLLNFFSSYEFKSTFLELIEFINIIKLSPPLLYHSTKHLNTRILLLK